MFWHYTTGANMRKIRADGFLRPSRVLVPKGERPVLRFTMSETFEPTAVKMFCNERTGETTPLTMEQTEQVCGGLYRLGIEKRLGLNGFERTCRSAGTDQRLVETLLSSAVEHGSDPLHDWFGFFYDVPLSACVVERFNRSSGRWEKEDEDEAAGSKGQGNVHPGAGGSGVG